jgi:hypothetical protein
MYRPNSTPNASAFPPAPISSPSFFSSNSISSGPTPIQSAVQLNFSLHSFKSLCDLLLERYKDESKMDHEWVGDLYQIFPKLQQFLYDTDIAENIRCEMWSESMNMAKKAFEFSKEKGDNDLNYRRFFECVINLLKKDFVYPTVVVWPEHQVVRFFEDERGDIASPLPSPTLPARSTSSITSECDGFSANERQLTSTTIEHPIALRPFSSSNLIGNGRTGNAANGIENGEKKKKRSRVSIPLSNVVTSQKTTSLDGCSSSVSSQVETVEILNFPSSSDLILWPNGLPKILVNGEKIRGPRQTSLKILKHPEKFTASILQIAQDVIDGKIKTSNGGGGWPETFPRLFEEDEHGRKKYFSLSRVCEEIISSSNDKYTADLKEQAQTRLDALKKKSTLSVESSSTSSSLSSSSSSLSISPSLSSLLSETFISSLESTAETPVAAETGETGKTGLEADIPPPPPLEEDNY